MKEFNGVKYTRNGKMTREYADYLRAKRNEPFEPVKVDEARVANEDAFNKRIKDYLDKYSHAIYSGDEDKAKKIVDEAMSFLEHPGNEDYLFDDFKPQFPGAETHYMEKFKEEKAKIDKKYAFSRAKTTSRKEQVASKVHLTQFINSGIKNNDLLETEHGKLYVKAGMEMSDSQKRLKDTTNNFRKAVVKAIPGILLTGGLVAGSILTGGALGFGLTIAACGTGAFSLVQAGSAVSNFVNSRKLVQKQKAIKYSLADNFDIVHSNADRLEKDLDPEFKNYNIGSNEEALNVSTFGHYGNVFYEKLSKESKEELDKKSFEEMLEDLDKATIYSVSVLGKMKKRVNNKESEEIKRTR